MSGHTVTVEGWNGRVLLVCSCSPVPISTRLIESDDGDYTTDDVDGLSMQELDALADEHWMGVLDR
jgi:hypothetical protein